MSVKKRHFYGLIVLTALLVLLALIGFAGAEWKETEISRNVLLPKGITISPPSPDLPKEVAAFLGRWEGVWDFDNTPAVLIVESISSTSANVILGIGKGRWGNKPDYSRLKAKVFLENKTRIEVPLWAFDRSDRYVVNVPFEISEDLETLHGESQGRGTDKASITMKKIED